MIELVENMIDSKDFIVVAGLDVAVVVWIFGVSAVVGDDVVMFETEEETVDATEDEERETERKKERFCSRNRDIGRLNNRPTGGHIFSS